MRGVAFSVAVNFDDRESGWVAGLLKDVETDAAGFLDAVTGVFDSRALEVVEAIGLDVKVHMQDVHETIMPGLGEGKA